MEWPDYVNYRVLFPSLSEINQDYIPVLSEHEQIWQILNPKSNNSLKNQIQNMIDNISAEEVATDSEQLFGITIDETKGPVMIQLGAQIEPGAHFIGPCFIAKDAQIRHAAYVRENSWICSNAVVGHCSEVKHSILLPGAKAPHFNYVGDSILGSGVNLGAGAKLSNLRNDGMEVNLRIGKSRFPSGLRKFGAILGENCQLGCNVVTNPGTVLGKDSVVWPNATVTGMHQKNSIHR